jgi:hypothetical protein
MTASRRTVSWEAWKQERRKTTAAMTGLAERLDDARDRRTRTAEERRALRRATLDAIARAERSGRLLWLGARRARIGPSRKAH